MSTIRPRTPCVILKATGGLTATGKPKNEFSRTPEKCHELDLSIASADSSVRTDQSASGGRASETTAFTHLMMKPKARVTVGDLIEIDMRETDKRVLRVVSIRNRIDVGGRPHHIELKCETWASK